MVRYLQFRILEFPLISLCILWFLIQRHNWGAPPWQKWCSKVLLTEIQCLWQLKRHTVDGPAKSAFHQLKNAGWSHHLQGFNHPSCCRISQPSTVFHCMKTCRVLHVALFLIQRLFFPKYKNRWPWIKHLITPHKITRWESRKLHYATAEETTGLWA